MKSVCYTLCFFLLITWQSCGFAFDETQLGSIKRLGELNGIALHCKFLQETQKIKRALVANLPKRRQLGELFDQETHNSFMRFISEKSSCPGKAGLAERVDGAIRDLEAVFDTH